MTRRTFQFASLGVVWLIASSAFAYSDPEKFSWPTSEGGGAGRWFTGSPADGYTCNVCHAGGEAAELAISGLPIDGYVPGASYEVIVQWPAALTHVGINAEITDERGNSAGVIVLPEGPTLDDREKCEPIGANIPASLLNAPSPARAVITVLDCGSRRLRLLWTAPIEPRGPLWLSGAMVHADGMGNVEGDGVTDFARPITTYGGEPIASSVGGCTVTSTRAAVPVCGWLLLALVGLWIRRKPLC